MSPGWLSAGLLLLRLALAGGEPPGEDPVTPLARLGARVERTAEGEVWAIDLSRAAGVNAGLDQHSRHPCAQSCRFRTDLEPSVQNPV